MNLLNVIRLNGEFLCHIQDTKFYKSVRLPNNLNAVLISSNSKEDSTASIALSIQAGSFDDPKNYEGLAHLMSNLVIRETKFIEEPSGEEDEIVEEKLVDAKSGRTKRSRSNKVTQAKKVAGRAKKAGQPKEKHTNSLMYLLNQAEGSIKLNTEFEYTTFQLDLPTKHLKSILDDFHLRFKDSPTFSEYLIKETIKLLKHDYFQKIKENSMMKLKMLLCHLVEDRQLKNYPSNPLLNSETDMNELRNELMNFYRTFYRPNRMKLILKSNLPIDRMEQMLNDSFGRLPIDDLQESAALNGRSKTHLNKLFAEKEIQSLFYIRPHNRKPDIEDYLPIRQNLVVDLDEFEEHTRQLEEKLVDENGLGKTISNKISYDSNHLIFSYTSQKQIQCKSDEQLTDQLCFIFELNYEYNYYPLMPLHFISSLICKDGPGTLVSYLRKHDLISKMQAGNLNDCNFANNSLWNLFFIKINLTKRGIGRLNEIIQCLNAYLAMLNKLDKKLCSLYAEHSKLTYFDYNFKEVRTKSTHDLFVTAKKMHLYPTKEILVANRVPLFHKLDKNLKVVRGLLKYMKLETCVIAVLTDESSFNSIDLNFETYKGIDVKKLPVENQLFQVVDLFSVDEFPETNRFLRDSGNHNQVKLESKVYYVPEQINQNERKQLWYKKESTELLSLTNVNLLISNDELKRNAKYACICDLLLVISEFQMQELFFEIREAGFLYRVDFSRFGLNIMAIGSDEVINVFKQILENFKSVATDDKLRKAKQMAMKSYEQAMKNKFLVYLDLQNCLLFRSHYSIQERMAELEKVTLKDLKQMMHLIFNESKRVYLVQGNYTLSDAKRFFTRIEAMFEYALDSPITTASHQKAGQSALDGTDFTISTDKSDESWTADEADRTNLTMDVGATRRSVNQTYNVKQSAVKQSQGSQPVNGQAAFGKPKRNEIFPIKSIECYCLVKLVDDSPALIPNEKMANGYDLSMTCNTPDSSFNHHQVRPDNQRHIESTSLKPAHNRRLFMDTNNYPSFNASRIGRAGITTNISRSRNRSSSVLSSICTDVTNTNYNLSPLNNSNDSADYSGLVGKDSQIIGNLYFTHYHDDVLHSVLLRLLVELIKQHMNSFFTNENNVRDRFFAVEEFKNSGTPEVTFQDQVVIDGQIECVEFELTDSLAESFLRYMFGIVSELKQDALAGLTKQLADDLAQKPSWAQDMNRNWNEIVLGKQRFELREKQRAALRKDINLGLFKRWSQFTLAKLNEYSKLSIQFQKDDEQRFDSDFCDKKKLDLLKPELVSLQPSINSWIEQEMIGTLTEFRTKY